MPTDTPTNSSDDPAKTVVSLSLDRDIVDWFKAHGPGYHEQMNRNLRAAMVDAQRHAALQADRARQKQQERLHQEMEERRAPAARAFFKALHAAPPNGMIFHGQWRFEGMSYLDGNALEFVCYFKGQKNDFGPICLRQEAPKKPPQLYTFPRFVSIEFDQDDRIVAYEVRSDRSKCLLRVELAPDNATKTQSGTPNPVETIKDPSPL